MHRAWVLLRNLLEELLESGGRAGRNVLIVTAAERAVAAERHFALAGLADDIDADHGWRHALDDVGERGGDGRNGRCQGHGVYRP